ncbi:class D sortase [Peribacillus acanthi]|uniref:class D sortase n=1 Tax=Peribacillus acanthi TaxID=2171554 RepID=UPI000D3E7FD8|nr:class D sortase [Peribacillus acanthi]
MKKIKKSFVPLILVVVGILIIIIASNDVYNQKIQQTEMLKLVKNNIQKRTIKTDFSSQIVGQEESIKEYAVGDVIGVLNIPTIQKELPIIEGVNEDELAKGVGHLPSTALPDDKDQIVLSGHRDTVFRKVGKLKIGDELQILMEEGVYIYKIRNTYIVDKDDRTIIKRTFPKEILYLSTCYPFSFIGNAPQRYIIEAERK